MTRDETVFTTHTPVAAGNEVHSLDLLHAMGAGGSLSREQMTEIGGDPFNMTAAGLRLSCRASSALTGGAFSFLHPEGLCKKKTNC